jgi:hypothetical protein
MSIPTYASWKQRTKRGLFTPRTDELVHVDDALQRYDLDRHDYAKQRANRAKLVTALKAWIKLKGDPAWKKSTRNTDGVVQELYDALQPYWNSVSGWVAPPLPANPKGGETYLGQSFEFANSKERSDVTLAFDRARGLVGVTYLALARAHVKDSPERKIFEYWFGPYNEQRLRKVRKNVSDIHGALCLKPVVLYYRGNLAEGPSDCPAEPGALQPGSYFGAAWKPANLPAAQDPKFTYVFLGSAFFKSGQYARDSIAGVIIHELSHAICSTEDVIYNGAKTYGPKKCHALAGADPALAITNADSYEYLCEHYQNRMFVPQANTLVLPPKASVVLNLDRPV